jgi:hypothetical protein
VDRITFCRTSFLFSVNSSRVKPVIKEKYAGINGRIQGEKNESKPAIIAAE